MFCLYALALTFPALALGMEEAEDDLMKRKPRDPNEGIFAGGLGVNVIVQGVFIGLREKSAGKIVLNALVNALGKKSGIFVH